MPACPDEATVLAFTGGALDAPARRAVEAHLAACAECRVLISELARRSGTLAMTMPTAFGHTRPAGGVAPTINDAGGAVPSDGLPKPGDVVGGKYEVEWVIGAGGMGVVLAAQHRLLKQRVAIKFPVPELRYAPQGRERLLREARACARLRSEHAVRLLDVDTLEDGSPYVVMEYLLGRTLAARLREHGPMASAEAVDVVVQACEALQEAHAAGIVHRDLKPSNLFETNRFDGSPMVKVLDFGIAKARLGASQKALTGTFGVLGSPGYMSPEQIRSTRDVDARADIWALGVTLHELATGELPGSARVHPNGLDRVVRRCLEHDPSKRFATAAQLASALAPFGGPTARAIAERLAQPHSSVPPRRRRQRPVLALSLAAGVVAAGVAASAAWLVRGHIASPEPTALAQAPDAPAKMSTAPPAATVAPLPTPAVSLAPESDWTPVPTPSASAVASARAPVSTRPPQRPRPAVPAPNPASVTDPHGLSDRK
jgi:tRNA A-37 threonylcarbamoyl transferase component Bud32